MDIGIIGSGRVGLALGALWSAAGHRVLVGSRAPRPLAPRLRALGPLARAGTPAEAARFGEAVLEAIPFHATPDLPADALRGKVVLTASNWFPERDGSQRFDGLSQSEWVAAWLPEARVVKAFNALPVALLEASARGERPRPFGVPASLYAGGDPAAAATASGLIRAARLDPVWAGPLPEGRLFEPRTGPLFGLEATRTEMEHRLDTLRLNRQRVDHARAAAKSLVSEAARGWARERPGAGATR